MPMNSSDVLEVLGLLEAVGIPVWIGGGWGVDALVGQETRSHEDVDIAVPASDEGPAIATLTLHRFRIIEETIGDPAASC